MRKSLIRNSYSYAILLLVLMSDIICQVRIPLICDIDSYSKQHYSVNISSLRSPGFEHRSEPLICPVAFDYLGRKRSHAHMCTAASQQDSCIFTLREAIITNDGAIIDFATLKPYSFRDQSMSKLPPLYYPGIHTTWSNYFDEKADEFLSKSSGSGRESFRIYELVVPLRMRWDDCFNHLSFQTLPWIALVLKVLPKEVQSHVIYHCSLFSAALLQLLDIPASQIVIEESIRAKRVILPWVKGWCPAQVSSVHGIANTLAKKMTKNLIEKFEGGDRMTTNQKQLNNDLLRSINSIILPSVSSVTTLSQTLTSDPSAAMQFKDSKKDLILYLPRPMTGTRAVVNDAEIIDALKRHMNHSNCELYIIARTKEYKTIAQLHKSWYRYAALFSRARLIIGPHGGALNNLMWSSSDRPGVEADIIEFNAFPDDAFYSQSHGGTPARHVFLTSKWHVHGALEDMGKFYIIEPSVKHHSNLYVGKLRVSLFELFTAIQRTDIEKKTLPFFQGRNILVDNFSIARHYKPECHETWKQRGSSAPKGTLPDFTYIPPVPLDYNYKLWTDSLV